jgi:hypothetical protein
MQVIPRRRPIFSLVLLAALIAGFIGLDARIAALAQPAKTPVPVAPTKALPKVDPKTKTDPKTAPKGDPTDEFFDKGIIPQIKITLTKEQEQKLRANQRAYVECTLLEDGKTTYEKVRVKLKGAAGSFRNFDDRPALTINMPPGKKENFHGLDKFHLNNSVQDESYMSELICSQLCREAGYPATRVTHARVWLQGRDLGFYVLKEGFNDDFLKRNFPSADGKGNFYDGGFCQDIDANLERDEGEGPDDKADLKAVIAACREGDAAKRKMLLEERVDIDAFLTFTALELMMCHWDGYVQNRNNYRVYFRGDTKKAVFFLHGMDQMFGDANFSVFHVPGPLVANAVRGMPDWNVAYREKVRSILPLFTPEKLHAKVDVAHKRIRPVVAAMGEDRAKYLDDRVRDFRNRLNDRWKLIKAQFPPEPIPFNKEGWAAIDGWEAKPEGDAKLEKKEVQGRQVLTIETGPSNNCVASFRTKIRLGKGVYKIEAKVKPTGVRPISGDKSPGAGIRVSGVERQNRAAGTTGWQGLTQTIEVTEDLKEIELVAELRSVAGGVVFDVSTMRVVKVK